MQQLKEAFAQIIEQGTEEEILSASALDRRFVTQVRYKGLSIADQHRAFVSAFSEGDRQTLAELASFARDEQVRQFAKDALGLGPEKPAPLETRPTRSIFGNVDQSKTI